MNRLAASMSACTNEEQQCVPVDTWSMTQNPQPTRLSASGFPMAVECWGCGQVANGGVSKGKSSQCGGSLRNGRKRPTSFEKPSQGTKSCADLKGHVLLFISWIRWSARSSSYLARSRPGLPMNLTILRLRAAPPPICARAWTTFSARHASSMKRSAPSSGSNWLPSRKRPCIAPHRSRNSVLSNKAIGRKRSNLESPSSRSRQSVSLDLDYFALPSCADKGRENCDKTL